MNNAQQSTTSIGSKIAAGAVATAKFVGHTAAAVATVAAGVTAAHFIVGKLTKKD